jgi:hypothetical protein
MRLKIAAYLFVISLGTISGNELKELPDNYLPMTFRIENGKLAGRSEYLEGFTFSMDLPADFLEKPLNITELYVIVRGQKITGTLTHPNDGTTEIVYEIVDHHGCEEVYMKTSLGYFLWEALETKDNELSFAINWWYCPPARQVDLDALVMSEQLLADPSNWHKTDDRKCEDDIENNKWSLFCALKYASIQTMGEYNHHNTAMQTCRFVIDSLIPGHGFEHTLMDFNNAPSTTHQDILFVIDEAKKRVEKDLDAKGNNSKMLNR